MRHATEQLSTVNQSLKGQLSEMEREAQKSASSSKDAENELKVKLL